MRFIHETVRHSLFDPEYKVGEVLLFLVRVQRVSPDQQTVVLHSERLQELHVNLELVQKPVSLRSCNHRNHLWQSQIPEKDATQHDKDFGQNSEVELPLELRHQSQVAAAVQRRK